MSYKVPDEDTVSGAIEAVMERNPHIETQNEFLNRVRAELLKIDKEYRVSGERIRRIGLERGIVTITIEYRESDEVNIPHTCPVCKNAMASVMNRSLDGDLVEIKRKCTICSYAVGTKVMVPGKYIFSRVRNKKTMDPRELAIRKLRKAAARIKEASKLVSAATENTVVHERGAELTSDLKELVSSDELSYSISNLILDIKENDEPGWTRPTVSVKNVDRNDI